MAELHKPLRIAIFFLAVAISVALLVLIWARLPTPASVDWLPFLKPFPVATSTAVTTPTLQVPVLYPSEASSTKPVLGLLKPIRPTPLGTLCDDQHFLCVTASASGTILTNPFFVTGTAIAFENQFEWQVEDASGQPRLSGHVQTTGSEVGGVGSFTIRDFWLENWIPSKMPSTSGTLHLFERSAKDGSMIHEVRLPVVLPSFAARSIKLFFLPVALGKKDCSAVKSVSATIGATLLPMEASLRKLLSVDSSDTPKGYETLIPDRTQLRSIVFSQGLVKVVFDGNLVVDGLDTCRVNAIRAQITQTLKQFSGVKQVEISIEGKTPEQTFQK